MHGPHPFSAKSVLGCCLILLGLPVFQAAQAAVDDPASTETLPIPAPKPVKAPLTGPQVYNNVCVACHSPPGVGGAPAFGDATAWAPRIAQGMDTLTSHALNGFTGKTGVMPKKGERLDLSDQEIVEAVKYMVEKAAQ